MAQAATHPLPEPVGLLASSGICLVANAGKHEVLQKLAAIRAKFGSCWFDQDLGARLRCICSHATYRRQNGSTMLWFSKQTKFGCEPGPVADLNEVPVDTVSKSLAHPNKACRLTNRMFQLTISDSLGLELVDRFSESNAE